MMSKNARIVTALLLGLVIIMGVILAIRETPETRNDKINVTATFYPFEEFAYKVGGDKVNVINVTPAGSEPHDYEPTPQQLVSVRNSQVLIYNGAGMEPWVDDFLPDFKGKALPASQKITLRADKEHDDEKDPHFWLDPVLAEQVVDNIADTFAAVKPGSADYFRRQAANYKTQLQQLDQDYREALSQCQQDTIITSHEAFGYVAARYGFKAESIAGISPEEEPSPAKLAELTQLVKQKNIHYIFFESLVSPRLADTIAHETGAKTAVFDPIEGISNEDQKKGKNYLVIQRENLAELKRALSCGNESTR